MSQMPWYMSPNALDFVADKGLDPEVRGLVENFLRQGYIVVPESVRPDLCDRIVGSFKDFASANDDKFAEFRDASGHYPRLVNMHLALEDLFLLFAHNKALAVTDFLFQNETVLYTSLFYERGSAQDTHRDTPYFATRPEYRYVGVWVALEDTDPDNGALEVVEGGHLMPELDREALAIEMFGSLDRIPDDSHELWLTYQGAVNDQWRAQGLKTKQVQVKKGDTIIWHPQLPHGGSQIGDLARTRFSFVMHVTPPSTPVYHHRAFFNPTKFFPETAGWSYQTRDARRYAKHPQVSFAHQKSYAPSEFRVPANGIPAA